MTCLTLDILLQTAPLFSLITVRLALGIPKQKEAQTERGSTEITHDMSPHTWVTSCTTWSKSAGEHLPMSPHPPTTMDKRTLAVPLYRTGPPSPQYPLEPTRSQVVSRGNQRSECECHEGLCWAEAKHIKTCKRCWPPKSKRPSPRRCSSHCPGGQQCPRHGEDHQKPRGGENGCHKDQAPSDPRRVSATQNERLHKFRLSVSDRKP